MTACKGTSFIDSGGDSRPGSTASDLLAAAQAMSPQAWEQLVEQYARLITYWAKNLGIPSQSLPDVLQAVLLKAARYLPSFQKDGRKAAFRRWLRTITYTQVAQFQRLASGRPEAAGGSEALEQLLAFPDPKTLSDEDGSGGRGDELDEFLELVRLECCEATWQAFWLTTFGDHTSSEAARFLDMTPNAVRLAKSRVLHRLRQLAADRDKSCREG